MHVPPMPLDEAERIAALVSCGVLDSDPEAGFDDLAQLAASLCGVPIALVSLIDRSRQWFKAKVGLRIDETPRDFSFCSHAICARTPLIVPDALDDPRFADNPLVVGDPFIRFYAGVPLVLEADDVAVGTLCVIDHVPRQLTREQLDSLTLLARRASKELSLRRKLAAAHSGGPQVSHFALTQPPPLSTAERALHRPAELPVALGEVVGDRYRVERVLGVGGMGVVAAARDLTSGVTVAIKFMQPSSLAQVQALRRFVREAQALFALESEHIARMLDAGNVASGAPYIVMEYLEGTDLAARLASEGPLPAAEVVSLMLQTCTAVSAAHAADILHRDLKPANLFLTRGSDGRPVIKVLDFGISKLTSKGPLGATALTGDAASLGSPHYMSPEQMLGAAEVDARSDIWSLGVVLYELLSGRTPFEGANMIEICAKVLSLTPPSLAEAQPETPLRLVRIVERCLEKDPARRFADIDDLRGALSKVGDAPPHQSVGA
ncbi:MAG: Sensor histidine kinase [Myxococcaceae bacterium]|nr:Sensor histidine kinase [Myxococcaceae bacterium]